MSDTPTKKRKWRWTRLLLIASLAVNLIILGVFAGAAFRFGGMARVDGGDFGAPYVRALSRDERKSMRDELRRLAKSRPDDKAARREIYERMGAALRAEPFVPSQVQDLLKHQRNRITGFLDVAEDVWLNQVSEMSVAQRAAYAARLEDVLARGPTNWKRR